MFSNIDEGKCETLIFSTATPLASINTYDLMYWIESKNTRLQHSYHYQVSDMLTGQTSMPWWDQRLSIRGWQMDVDHNLDYYGTQDGDTLECQIRAGGARGGRCFACRTPGLT
jgi:hypothetical protein